MTAWAPQFDQKNKDHFNGRSDLRSNERFEKTGAWGPNPIQISEHFPEILTSDSYTWTTDPSRENATAVGDYACFWVWNPKDRDYGVWALAAVDRQSMKDAADKQSPVAYGWYAQIAKKLPTYRQMVDSGLPWQAGFFEAYLRAHPNEDPLKKKKPATLPADFRTYEVLAVIDGQPVPLTDVVRYVGGSDYELAPGASIAISDSEEDGFNLAGEPGKWGELYGTQSPAQFGLDRNRGVLFFNGQTQRAQALPAKVLLDWYGPGWRREVYGSQ